MFKTFGGIGINCVRVILVAFLLEYDVSLWNGTSGYTSRRVKPPQSGRVNTVYILRHALGGYVAEWDWYKGILSYI